MEPLEAQQILGSPLLVWFAHYGYFVIVPLMIVEGPIVTIIAGVLCSLGVFNPLVIAGLSFVSDMVSDTGYYIVGKYSKSVLYKFKFTRFIASKLEGDTEHMEKIGQIFENHGQKTMLIMKSLPGLTTPTLFATGVLRVKLRKFWLGLVGGGIIYSSFLVALGYFLGHSIKHLASFVTVTGFILTGLLLLILFLYLRLGEDLASRTAIGAIFRPRKKHKE